VFFAGLLVHLWTLAAAGVLLMLLVLLWWMWPSAEAGQTEDPEHV
jgi:hypothetical protein